MTASESVMRWAGSFESGMSALYFASISLHSMPRGAEPRGASTLLVNRAPDVVTIVTVGHQPYWNFWAVGAGSVSMSVMSLWTTGLLILAGVTCTHEKSLSATADATK